MTKANHTSTLLSQRLPSQIQKNLVVTRKSQRNYEVVVCINVGRLVTVALAVIENGHATFSVGELSAGELKEHFSKIDLAIGTYLNTHALLRTDTILELMEQSGVEIYKETPPDYSTRYYQKELTLKIPTKRETVAETIRKFLQDKGFSVERIQHPVHVRYLERMRHRTGYIIPRE